MQIQKVIVVNLKTDISSIVNYMTSFNISVILIRLDNSNNNLQIQENNNLVEFIGLDDDLSCLKEVNWVINIDCDEDNVDSIYNIYNRVMPYLSDNVIISSSSVFLFDIINSISSNICYNLMIACFPSYAGTVKLIECAFYECDERKSIIIKVLSNKFPNLIVCNNTPGLILERILSFWLLISIIGAHKFNIPIEEADFIISNKYMGVPHGIFNLLDDIGLNNFILTVQFLVKRLPCNDHLCELYNFIPEVVLQMISDGYTGIASDIGGFYRFYELYNGNNNQVIDLRTGLYRSVFSIDQGFINIDNLFNTDNKYGQFMWYIWSNTLVYVASLIPELSFDISIIDKAIKLVYNWKYGPFEIIDLLNDYNGNKLWFFNSVKHNNLPQILSFKKSMYNDKRQYISINGSYV
ncbi:3-hydroxyacyl-CoA dehydrogenase [Ehrlichia sp. JZT12]